MKSSIGRLMKGVVVGFPVVVVVRAGEGEKNVHSKTQALRARQLLMMMMKVAMESRREDCIGGHG